MKNIKTLGLLAVAAMVIAAFIGTASASAVPTFKAGASGATLTEETVTQHVFTVTGSQTECTEIGFAGKTEGTTSYTSQKVKPTYNKCTAFGFPATVTVGASCEYTLDANGQVNLIGTGCVITIKVDNFFAKCTALITNQEIPNAVSYTDHSGHVSVNINASGIDAEVTTKDGLCPLDVGKHTDATYTGKSTVKATGTTIGWTA